VKPEKSLYHKFKKNCPNLLITSIECYNIGGIPDCLVWSKSGGFAMVELKHTETNKCKFSAHQILFAYQRKDLINGNHRNFILVQQALKGDPRSIKLYGSNSVEGLLLDIREVKPLATNDWKLIEKIISNQKNN
tara:strand:- start:64 stop:465 length:402 start_codon:yes stop_codon:yes gene_type:complete